MAERRMFSKTIIDSDAFLDMALSTQALYFHLSMRADDDGFINNPKKIIRMVGASDDELKILLAKKFIIAFESGVIVIKHWRMHNYIQKDRYKPTVYTEELAQLTEKENKAYSLDATCIQDVYKMDSQVRLGKISLDKDSIDKDKDADKPPSPKSKFTKPTIEDIKDYCIERNNNISAESFFNHYESNGWMVGRNKMKDWKAAIRTWEQKQKEFTPQQKVSNGNNSSNVFFELLKGRNEQSDNG